RAVAHGARLVGRPARYPRRSAPIKAVARKLRSGTHCEEKSGNVPRWRDTRPPPCFAMSTAGEGYLDPNRARSPMILRIDRLATELPPPSSPDPAGASVVQELLGGKFGEM